MPRKIPNRSGAAVSNAARLERTESFADSASRYMAKGAEAKEIEQQLPRTGRLNGEALEFDERSESREERMAASTAEAHSEGAAKPDRITGASELRPSVEGPPAPLTYYARLRSPDLARIAGMAAATGMDEGYIRKALAKGVREHLNRLRDEGAWMELSDTAVARLDDRKGSGAALMKGMLRLSHEQETELRATIRDPLGIHGTTQILSAYAKAALANEIDGLEIRIKDWK